MTKKIAKSLWRLCGALCHSKKLCNHGGYTLLNDSGNSNVISKHGDHVKKRTRCPQGHVSVLVGEEGKRYFIPIAYLSHQAFTFLLERTRFESGYKHDCEGGILLMCDVEVFENLIRLIQNNPSQSMDVVLQDVLDQLEAMEWAGPQIVE